MPCRGTWEGDVVGTVHPSRVAQGESALLIRAWSLFRIQSRLPVGDQLNSESTALARRSREFEPPILHLRDGA